VADATLEIIGQGVRSTFLTPRAASQLVEANVPLLCIGAVTFNAALVDDRKDCHRIGGILGSRRQREAQHGEDAGHISKRLICAQLHSVHVNSRTGFPNGRSNYGLRVSSLIAASWLMPGCPETVARKSLGVRFCPQSFVFRQAEPAHAWYPSLNKRPATCRPVAYDVFHFASFRMGFRCGARRE